MEDISASISARNAVVAVFGLGYVGLPTAVHFAEAGFRVIGVDVNPRIVDNIQRGESPFPDLDLDARLANMVKGNMLSATTDHARAVADSTVILIIVPTPVYEDRTPDLRYVTSAGKMVAEALTPGKLVILESTVYPGVTEEILEPELSRSGLVAGTDYGLAYCPERYNPGDPLHTLDKVDRIIGAKSDMSAQAAWALYSAILPEEKVHKVGSIKTAEAAKVIENTQRDLNIALMNELALIFERMGIDVLDVIAAARTKWNFRTYYPGAGVGGHCLPVDPYYLVKKSQELGYHPKVITAGREVNDTMPLHIMDLLQDALNEAERAVKNSKVVVLGLSYKENVGDPRESPTHTLLKALKRNQAKVCVVDPLVPPVDTEKMDVCMHSSVEDAMEGADAVIMMTPHEAFRGLTPEMLGERMTTRIIIDGRRIFDPETFQKAGFIYKGVGWSGNI